MFEGFSAWRTFDRFSNSVDFFFVYIWGKNKLHNHKIPQLTLCFCSPLPSVTQRVQQIIPVSALLIIFSDPADLSLVRLQLGISGVDQTLASWMQIHQSKKLSVSKWNSNLCRLVSSVCILTAAKLIPCSLSFFDLCPEIFPFASLPNVPQLFFSHLSLLLLFTLVSLLLVGVMNSSEPRMYSLAIQNMHCHLWGKRR